MKIKSLNITSFKREKRGMLLEEIFGIILAAVIILGLIYVLLLLLGWGALEKEQAKGLLDEITAKLNALKDGETTSILVYVPVNWWVSTYVSDSNLCVCPDSWGNPACLNIKKGAVCETLSKSIYAKSREKFSFKIEKDKIHEIYIKNTDSNYEMVNVLEAGFKSSDCDKAYGGRKSAVESKKCIKELEKHKEYNPFIQTAVVNSFPDYTVGADMINFVKAQICIESQFVSDAVSRSGAAGLMQLMPDTARELKLNVPCYDYSKNECINGRKESCCINGTENTCCKTKGDPNCERGKCLSGVGKKDERFEPQENIDKGVKFLKYLLDKYRNNKRLNRYGSETINKKIALIAYNYNQNEEKILKCLQEIPPDAPDGCPQETLNYFPLVMCVYLRYSINTG